MRHAVIVADDLTGASDTGAQFARAGYRAAVVFRGETVSLEEADVVAVDTDSRALDANAARERVLEAGGILRDARIAYKKLDSTLRGPVAAELEAALPASGRRAAVIAPAFPSAGRTTIGGAQMVHGVPVHQSGFAEDRITPVRESRIPALLAGLGPVRTLGVEEIGDEEAVRAALQRATWIVADAETDAHLEALVLAVSEAADASEVLWMGSAGLARALAAVYPGPHSGGLGEPPPAPSALVVVGSVSKVSREQLRVLCAEPEAVPVALDSRRVDSEGCGGSVGEAFAGAREALCGGHSVALHSTVGREAGTEVTAGALAEVVAWLSEEGLVRS